MSIRLIQFFTGLVNKISNHKKGMILKKYMQSPTTMGFNKLSETLISTISIAPNIRAPIKAKNSDEKILIEKISIIIPEINPNNIPPKVPS